MNTESFFTADQIERFASRAVDADKTIIVEIDVDDLSTLKDNGYRLCFAKKTGSSDELTYDVVWQAYLEYLSYNYFGYVFDYQIFCTNNFEDGALVQTRTTLVDIDFGEESTLNEFGVLSPAVTGTDPDSIVLNNEYGPIYPGLCQAAINLEGAQENAPIYVDETEAIVGTSAMTTVDEVLVWFEQNTETGTMFSTERSNSFAVDLTSTDLATVLYQGGVWSLQPNPDKLAALLEAAR